MKIGIVSPYYMHAYGGVQTLISDLAKHLRLRGHQVIIIAPNHSRQAAVAKQSDDLVLLGDSIHVNFKNPFHTTFPIAASNSQIIADFLEQENFDVLNIHEPWMLFLPYQIMQQATDNYPIVATTHARWPRSLFTKSLEKLRTPYFRSVLQKIDKITAVSPVSALNITLIDEETEVQIIPNGIDLPYYQKTIKSVRSSQSRPFILYLNRLEKRKGPRLLLKAYNHYVKNIASRPLPLIFAGSGPLMPALKADTERYNLEHLVRFEGFVSQERKMELFANASLYVTPAPYGESFGIVLLEAMASDLPFLAGDNEGYRVVATDAGSVSLVNPYQINQLAHMLHSFSTDKILRQRWLNWARHSVQQYDYSRVVDQYEACFLEAARNKKRNK